MNEAIEYANSLVLKNPSFDVLRPEHRVYYPHWVVWLVETLQSLHQRKKLHLPDLRAHGNEFVTLFSDYGGEHKKSKFLTYSVLITGNRLAVDFLLRMEEIRKKYSLNQTEIAFKNFKDGRIVAALPDYLTALNNLLPGLLLTLVVDKQVSGLFGFDLRKDSQAILSKWEGAGFKARKPPVIEKTLRVVHLAAFLTGLLGHEGQKLFWMTDHDAISEGEIGAEETFSIFDQVLKIYTRSGMEFEPILACNPFAQKETRTLDLLSAADIVSGALADYLTKYESMPASDILVKPGCDHVLRWMPLDGVGLGKLAVMIRPDADGIRLGEIEFNTGVEQKVVSVPIYR